MSPCIFVCDNIIASFILAGNYEELRFYTSKRVNKNIPVNCKNAHWSLACVVNPGLILNKYYADDN